MHKLSLKSYHLIRLPTPLLRKNHKQENLRNMGGTDGIIGRFSFLYSRVTLITRSKHSDKLW